MTTALAPVAVEAVAAVRSGFGPRDPAGGVTVIAIGGAFRLRM
ncbi:MAG: hypothetical protein ACT4P1_00765 [Sporichthyaceae bacterium]